MTLIYHITHISNLCSILECGGIHCDREIVELGLAGQGIAHSHIKARRARRAVPVCRGGTLADYVPFYFAPRSPMLYALHRGAVEGYTGGQRSILHLVGNAEEAVAGGLACAFTDGHAELASRSFTKTFETSTRSTGPLWARGTGGIRWTIRIAPGGVRLSFWFTASSPGIWFIL